MLYFILNRTELRTAGICLNGTHYVTHIIYECIEVYSTVCINSHNDDGYLYVNNDIDNDDKS